MVELNSTIGMNATLGSATASWLVTAIIFFAALLFIFMLSKNFRQFLYGAVVTGALFGIYAFSRWVGSSYSKGNGDPLKWSAIVFGFSLVSIGVGRFLERFKFFKKLEAKIK